MVYNDRCVKCFFKGGRSMNIIIVGCGKVGQTLAGQLNEEGNNITVIDLDSTRVNSLISRQDIMGIVGNGATHAVQVKAGIDKADLLIAVTGSDELNLLCCLTARMAGQCKTIAQVKNPVYHADAAFLKDELGLAMVINPEQAAAAEIARILRFPSAIKIDTFAKGKVELIKFRLPENCPIVGMTVREAVSGLGCDVLFCTVERGDQAYIVNGDFIFSERDILSIIASPRQVAAFFRKINYKSRAVKDVLIAGGGEMTHYLTDILRRSGIAVKIIEKDMNLCESMSNLWPDVTVVRGDAVDKDLLLEEGITNAGAFVALTNLDEENIMLSLFAQSVGKCKIVTKINRIDFDEVIKRLELDSIIYPKHITAEQIERYARAAGNTVGSNMETLYHVISGRVEAAEFTVSDHSKVTDTPLSRLSCKEGVLVAAIIRGGNVIIPHGQDTIQVGDSVVIVSKLTATMVHDLCDILE